MESPPEPRPIDALLTAYRRRHRHRTNEIIHCVCVPCIVFAVLGLAWTMHPLATVALSLAALRHYFPLSRTLAIGMSIMLGAMLILLLALPPATILPLSLAILVLAWSGQFIGHMIEGEPPSAFGNPRFFLIGPLFVLSSLCRRFELDY
ncbi:MAG: DUF962 domain-containing protein [Burkholderiaceae bacterium]|nr:DUF962 domain-containing protein [Burkholderiaceae bacterium]